VTVLWACTYGSQPGRPARWNPLARLRAAGAEVPGRPRYPGEPAIRPATRRPPADQSSTRASADPEERNHHHVQPLRRAPTADDQESPARTHRFTIGAAAVIPALLIGLPGGTRSDAPHDSGLIACRYPLSTQDVPVADYARLRAQFAGSRWPDLRNAGTTYVDLATQLPTARYTDGYQTVWFHQRLTAACAKHGQ